MSADLVQRLAQLPAGVQAIPVLNYHDVSHRSGLYTVTPENFAEQLATLSAAGYKSVTLNDVHALVSGERPALPAHPVLITFDDGVGTEFTDADPILERYGFAAVTFVITGSVTTESTSYYLTEPQLKSLAQNGRWSVQSHSDHGHRTVTNSEGKPGPSWLSNLLVGPGGALESFDAWRSRVVHDLGRSKDRVMELSGKPAVALSYPFSTTARDSNDARIPPALESVVGANFSMAFTAALAPYTAILPSSDPSMLPRFEVTSGLSTAGLVDALGVMLPGAMTSGPDGWGLSPKESTCVVSASTVVLGTSRYGRCAPKVANEGWANYRLHTTVSGISADATPSISVLDGVPGRVEVAVSPSSYVVRQMLADGTWMVLLAQTTIATSSTHRVAIEARGSVVTVAIDDGPEVTVGADPSLSHGAVGLGLATSGAQSVTFTGTQMEGAS